MDSGPAGQKERRGCARGPFVGVVDYQGMPGVYSIGVTDISCSGIRVVLTGPEEPGTIAELRLSIAGMEDQVEVTARVVWATPKHPYEAGLCFLNLSPAVADQVQRLADQGRAAS